jgi:hypothetical protein
MGKFQSPFYPFKTLTEGFRKGENEDKNDWLQDYKRLLRRNRCWKRQRNAEKRLCIETQNKFVHILLALLLTIKTLAYLYKPW